MNNSTACPRIYEQYYKEVEELYVNMTHGNGM